MNKFAFLIVLLALMKYGFSQDPIIIEVPSNTEVEFPDGLENEEGWNEGGEEWTETEGFIPEYEGGDVNEEWPNEEGGWEELPNEERTGGEVEIIDVIVDEIINFEL